MITDTDKAQALKWYIDGWSLQTIADHFKVTVPYLKSILNTENNHV